MTTNSQKRVMRRLTTSGLAVGLLLLCSNVARAQRTASAAAADTLLSRLVGTWRMTGHVRNKPATYTLSACRTLANRFVELHMVDVHTPPAYEARVFLGAAADSATPNRVIVHWLDSFGAAFSIPHATGAAVADTIRFEFPYRDGPFRDTFVHDSARDRWNFLLEAGDGHGGWKTFAEYDVERVAVRPPDPCR